MTKKRYRPADQVRWLTAPELGRELGRTAHATRRLLMRNAWLRINTRRDSRGRLVYESTGVEVLKGVLGLPHREVVEPGTDWLTKWIGEAHE